MVRQFRVAAFIVEAILKGIKTQSGLEGQIEVGVLDQQENTGSVICVSRTKKCF